MDFLEKFEERYGENYPYPLELMSDYYREVSEDDDGDTTVYYSVNLSIREYVNNEWRQLVIELEEEDQAFAASFSALHYDEECKSLLAFLEDIHRHLQAQYNTITDIRKICFFKIFDMHRSKFLAPLLQQDIDRINNQISNLQSDLNSLYDRQVGNIELPVILSGPLFKRHVEKQLETIADLIEKQRISLREYVVGCDSYVKIVKRINEHERRAEILKSVINNLT